MSAKPTPTSAGGPVVCVAVACGTIAASGLFAGAAPLAAAGSTGHEQATVSIAPAPAPAPAAACRCFVY